MEIDPDTRILEGRCECRAVRYRVSDAFLYAANCHCSNCRAGTGSAFKPFAGIERDKIEVLGGTETLASAPAAMTHLSVPDERKKQLDITPNLVRISIGVENADDLTADLLAALNRAAAPALKEAC